MVTDFFQHPTFQSFLRERYELLRRVRPSFSTRAFARKAGIKSHVYFRLVVSGQRHLSSAYAERFARGLGLDAFEKDCLLTSVALEHAPDQKTRTALLQKLQKLKRRANAGTAMQPDQLKVLADLQNLRLYLLAQSTAFKPDPKWLQRASRGRLSAEELEKRVRLLYEAGLWVKDGDQVRTVAPLIRSGDKLAEVELLKTHKAFLGALNQCLEKQAADQRIVGARTFLFDAKRLPEVQKRLEEFRAQLEADFEDMTAISVYTVHVGFFEL